MNIPKAPNAAFHFLLIILFSKLSYCIGNYNSINFCPEIEKQSLLTFKQSLKDPSNSLSSWKVNGGINCCKWKGVVCNNYTGNVHQLHLRSYDLSGKLNPSLLNLKHLRYLDLSDNYFNQSIPSAIGSFSGLKYLNLSFAGFYGTIPHTIGNLSNLRTLSMMASFYDGELQVDSLEWLSGLSQLERLNMGGVNLSRAATKWIQVIDTLSSLVELRFHYCSLNFIGPINENDVANVSSLAIVDLRGNDFGQSIPSFIGSFPGLKYLDLSFAGFYGTIPHTVGNLSNLRTLNMGGNDLHVDSLEVLSDLSQLQHLDMSRVNLSRAATKWIQVMNALSSLVELRFSFCSLNFIGPTNDVVNVSSLAILDLSYNEFQSFVNLEWILQLRLIHLDLSDNYFEGPIPNISNTTKIQYVDLSSNHFNSTIPDWLYSCKVLEYVYLYGNSLHGTISNDIANLSSLNALSLSDNELSGKIPREIANLCKIKVLGLDNNMFHGELSDSFGNMSDCFLGTLEVLSLGFNRLTGHIPDQFGEFKNLRGLSLVGKKLMGNLPRSLGKLYNLEWLYIEQTMLDGEVNESHFFNLTKLEYLHLSQNHLTLKVNPNWIPPFKLVTLDLSGSLGVVGTQIPSWLDTQESMSFLFLSSTGISGHVPRSVWKNQVLNLSNNHLHDKIPDITGPLDGPRVLYLSSNQFSGSLPRVGPSVAALDLSNNSFSGGISHFLCDMTNETYKLEILHLEENKLTGELPDCLMKWPLLRMLNLGNNKMYGSIPNSIGSLRNLVSLNLHGNRFSGRLPFSMHSCSRLRTIDLSHNHFDGNMPIWIGTSLTNLTFLILRSNKLSGVISSEICHLNSLQILDLSDNEFFGIIPKCFNNFTAMAKKRSSPNFVYSLYAGAFMESAFVYTKGSEYQYDTILGLVTNINLSKNNFSGDIPEELTSLVELRVLNLSENHLKGSIPNRIGDMKQLESLDFSRNFLSGEIPDSFKVMSFLNYLNLSYNNLTGKIPESTQILGFNASSFMGNDLCGPPLTRNCSNIDEGPGAPGNKEDDEGNKSEVDWFYIFLSLGYAVGFSVACTVLILKKSWKDACFGLLEDLWNKVYVYSYIKWRRFTER